MQKDALSWIGRQGIIFNNYSADICFSSLRFQWLLTIFKSLDLIVTFLFPVVAIAAMFIMFWRNRNVIRHLGRPYSSSTSAIVFILVSYLSYIIFHVPLELIAINVLLSDVISHPNDFVVYKLCQMASSMRSFADVIIFGVFRSP